MSETLEEAIRAMDGLDAFDPAETLVYAADMARQVNLAQAEVLKVAAHWADLNAVLDPVSRAIPGMERLVCLGGDGTPEVAEFAPAELGAQLRLSVGAAAMLIGDALDLRHRLPQLWELMCNGLAKPWVCRQVAQKTRRLSPAAAALVDRKVARYVTTMAWGRLEPYVDAAVAQADPAQAEAEAAAARDRQGVFVGREADHGYKTAFLRGAAPDIDTFDAGIDQIATALAALGDTDNVDIRRAKAIGIIASPQATLELFDLVAADRGQDTDSGGKPAKRSRTIGSAVVYVHLSDQAVAGTQRPGSDPTVARVEGVGPILLDQLREFLRHRNVTVKPVIDLPNMPAVDNYEIPDSLREAMDLRTPADCFPYGSRTTRHRDADHTIAYLDPDDGGPPGQTNLPNLGGIARLPHRIKTHGHWKVLQLISGVWLWTSPHGHHYLVDNTGTTNLGTL